MAPLGMEPAVSDPHAQHADDLALHLGVQLDAGLPADEVAARQQRHGPNRLPEIGRAHV